MRYLLMLGLMLGTFVASGVFVVDERQVAIIDSSSGAKIYSPGIHWVVPLRGKLYYIYTNQRAMSTKINLSINQSEQQMGFNLLINWQVHDPIIYSRYLDTHSKANFNSQLLAGVLDQLTKIAKSSTSLAIFENKLNETAHGWENKSLGIRIINISLAGAELINTNLQESAENIATAFDKAQKIKIAADTEQSNILKQLNKEDAKFFDYFMKIYHYQTSAKDKSEVPALNLIYSK